MRDREALLAVGSNVEPDRWVPRALAALDRRFEVVAVSPWYASAAVGAPGAPPFVNLVVRVRTDLPPRALRAAARRIEEICRRRRGADPNAPRTMDLDVVWTDDPAGAAPDLVLPAPELAEAAYVLLPAADVHPDLVPAGCGRTLAELAAALPASRRAAVRRRAAAPGGP